MSGTDYKKGMNNLTKTTHKHCNGLQNGAFFGFVRRIDFIVIHLHGASEFSTNISTLQRCGEKVCIASHYLQGKKRVLLIEFSTHFCVAFPCKHLH